MLGDVFTRVKKQSTRGIWLIGIAAFTVVLLLGSGTYFLFRRTQIKISSDLSTAQAKNDAAMARAQQEAEKSDEAEKQVAQLEAELQASNRRNDANHQALMAELEKARKEAEAQKAALALTRRESANSAAQLQSLLKQQQAAPAPAPVSKPETADPSKFDDLRRQIESQIDAKFEQDPAAAQDLADQLIQADAKRYEGYALAGRIASKRGDFRRAADMYQRAVDRAPADIRPSLEKQLEAARSLIP
jgi:flagellar biosynthesis GTPase FlhF